MLEIAYIGNGKSTNRYHAPFVNQLDHIQIKTIYSPSGKIRWEKLKDVHYTDRINDIWEDDKLDLVVITTPSKYHYSFAKEALEKGKNVLVDKPFAETSQEAKELFALAEEKGLFIQAYQNRRFDSDFLTLQKVIESGKLGDLLELEMHFDYYRPEVPKSDFSIIDSFLYAHGTHTVDQVLSYFGEPKDIHYDVRQMLGEGYMNDYFDLDFYYESPFKVSIKSSYFRVTKRPSFELYGKKGSFIKQTIDRQEEHLKLFYMPSNDDFGIDLPQHYGTLTYYDDEGNYHQEKVVSEVGDYSKMYQGIYDSIIHGKEKIVKDEETIRQIEILEEGIKHLK